MALTSPVPDALARLFAVCEELGASDIHLAPGLAPAYRVHGALAPRDADAPLAPADLAAVADALARAAGHASPDAPLAARGSFDGAISSPGGARYRFNVFRVQNHDPSAPAAPAVALRRLEDRFRTLAELGLPPHVADFCDFPHGLVLVTGPTGSGKTTTLATLLHRVNETRSAHVVTIEDPVEYVHRPIRCLVSQRQVGLDTPSFHAALVDALREDPDVILVGELRDLDTLRTALVAAETGHLVFATLHAGDCPGAVERFAAVFPPDEQPAVRRQLSLVLRAVLAQRLLPREDGLPGRVLAAEIMRATPAVANLVANGRPSQLYTAIETGASLNMQTFEADLLRLLRQGAISARTARALARTPDALHLP